MKFASRFNSFMHGEQKTFEKVIIDMAGISELHAVDLNYPEHFNGNNVQNMKEIMKKNGIMLNGIATRFRDEYINGELGNPDDSISDKALTLCFESIDVCREMGGKVVTIWLGYDGYDYSFQLDYLKAWKKVIQAFKKICDYAHDIQISIEYKPFQPRVHSLISSLGDTMTMLHEIDRPNLGVTLDFCHMLMKGENPAFAVSLLADKNKLFGIHLNDGNHLNDDGLMVGMTNFIQTLEFMYYLKKEKYEGVIYFDTFPIRENEVKECEANIQMVKQLDKMIDRVGLDRIEKVIDQNDALEVQKLMLAFLNP